MKTASPSSNVLGNHIVRIAVVTAIILSIPLIAMQFSSEVQWSLSDFIIIGTLLFGTGLAYELIASRLHTKTQRRVAAAVLLLGLLYVWAELAVGIFTNLGS